MLKVNVVFVLANVVFVMANVVFAKLAIGGRWVGGGGWFWLNIRNGFEEPFNKIQNLNKNINLNFTINIKLNLSVILNLEITATGVVYSALPPRNPITFTIQACSLVTHI